MENKLIVSSSPHLSGTVKTRNIMLDVIIALIPALIASVVYFGVRALIVVCVTVASCVIAEYICRRVMKRPVTIGDYSAVVTGMLLAFNLPVGIPLWIAAIGGVVAIVVVKQMFGGLGHNFANPAITARIILMTSFPVRMTTWVAPYSYITLDTTATASPLALIESGNVAGLPTYTQMFLGERAGCLGETCILALIIGGVYLIARKVISWKIPVCYIVTLGIFVLLFGGHGFDMTYLAGHLFGGGLMLGAFFMATDYVTSPITPTGKIVFGILLGIFTGIFRLFGGSAEGVSYAIIFCNLLVPLIEKFTTPAAFGKGGKKK